MLITLIQRFMWMLVLMAAQMLVFNHVHLFGYATPLPFVYLLLMFPLNTEVWMSLLWGFVCGLLTDIGALTPGVGAAALTLTAFIQPSLLKRIVPDDSVEDLVPSYATLGFFTYVRYAAIITGIFVVVYYLVLAFSFHNIFDWAISCASSWLLTWLLCLVFEGFRKTKKKI